MLLDLFRSRPFRMLSRHVPLKFHERPIAARADTFLDAVLNPRLGSLLCVLAANGSVPLFAGFSCRGFGLIVLRAFNGELPTEPGCFCLAGRRVLVAKRAIDIVPAPIGVLGQLVSPQFRRHGVNASAPAGDNG